MRSVPWTSDFSHISTRPRRRSLRCAPRKGNGHSFVARLASDADPASIYARNHWSRALVLIALGCVLVSACASQANQLTVAQARDKLRAGLSRPVHTREERDDQSRILVDAVEHAELERMTFSEVQATFGMGNVCQANDLCAAKGFSGDDVFYVMGQAADDKIKLLPTLILGFDPHGHVARVYTLRTDQ